MTLVPWATESVRDDPWKLLLAARLLNVTAGRMAIPVFWRIVARWPTPSDLLAGVFLSHSAPHCVLHPPRRVCSCAYVHVLDSI